MARKSKEEKLESIEEKIKKLQEEKKRLQIELQLNVGRTLLEEWDIKDEQTAISLITLLKEEAYKIIQSETTNIASGELNE